MWCRYVPVHLWFFSLFSTFAVLPAAYACAVWIGGSAIYYLSTIFGEPEHTGADLSSPVSVDMPIDTQSCVALNGVVSGSRTSSYGMYVHGKEMNTS